VCYCDTDSLVYIENEETNAIVYKYIVVQEICAQMGGNPGQIAIVINYIPNESSYPLLRHIKNQR